MVMIYCFILPKEYSYKINCEIAQIELNYRIVSLQAYF